MVVLLDATIVPLNAISPSEVVHATSFLTTDGVPNWMLIIRIVLVILESEMAAGDVEIEAEM